MANGFLQGLGRALVGGFAGAATGDPFALAKAEQLGQQKRLRALKIQEQEALAPLRQQEIEARTDVARAKEAKTLQEQEDLFDFNVANSLQRFGDNRNAQLNMLKSIAVQKTDRGQDPSEIFEMINTLERGDFDRFDKGISGAIEEAFQLGIAERPPDTRTALQKDALFASSPEGFEAIRKLSEAKGAAAKDDRTALIKNIDEFGERLGLDTKTPQGFSEATARFKRANKADPKSTLITFDDQGNPIIAEGAAAEQAAAGRREPTKATLNKLQDDLKQNRLTARKLRGIKKTFKPEFLKFQGKLKIGFLELKDKSPAQLNKTERAFLRQATRFEKRLNNFFVTFVQSISGAAVSAQEMKRLQEATINSLDSPTQFEAALDDLIIETDRAAKITEDIISDGFTQSQDAFNSEFDKRFGFSVGVTANERAIELLQEGLSQDEIEQTLIKERLLE